jgi:hypothetical protein
MRTDVTFNLNQAGVSELFSWGGPVGVYVERLANKTSDKAKTDAPVRTGTLRDSIRPEKSAALTGIAMDVTANVEYALPVHEGGEPHTITPKNGEFLVFPNKRGPGMIYARKVENLGSKANPFLWNALVDVVTRGESV